jgi:hypothetical protein
VGLVVDGKVGPLRKVLAEEAVGVLVAAAMPGTVGIAEIDLDTSVDRESDVLAHLLAAVPGEAPAKLLGQAQDPLGTGSR